MTKRYSCKLVINQPSDLSSLLLFDQIIVSDKLSIDINPDLHERLREWGFIQTEADLQKKGIISGVRSFIGTPFKYYLYDENVREIKTTRFGSELWINKRKEYRLKEFWKFLNRKGINTTPHYDFEKGFQENFKRGKKDCLSIIVSNFTKIDLSTNEKISDFLEFTKDDETIKLRRRLFNWINEIERQKIKPIELQELIATRLDDYKTWIETSKLKFQRNKFESIILTGTEFIEELINLKPSKALKKLFDFRKRKLDLTLGELTAPGRELAFIYHIQKKLSN